LWTPNAAAVIAVETLAVLSGAVDAGTLEEARGRCCLALNSRVRYNVSHTEREITMATTAMVHVRVNEKIKAQATKALTAMGLSVSDAVRVFLTRVAADKQLPFDLKVPNAETRSAMAEVDEMLSTRRARYATAEDLFDDLAKKRK
jgi:DNA-damage-inducible protein J